MSLIQGLRKFYIPLVTIALVAAFAYFSSPDEQAESGAPIATVLVPETLSKKADIGQQAFNQYCTACHGINAVGQVGIAPPLVHKIYEPSHHGDASFVRAAKIGVQQHHWPFGNMPPVEGITDNEIVAIIYYIRELQRFNGIQ